MDILMENIYIILFWLGIFCLMLSYCYSQAYPQKSTFQKPIDYVEIRTWRKKKKHTF